MKERKTGRNGAGGVANRTVKVHGRGMRIWKADRGERARRAFEEGLVLCARDGHASRVYVYTRQTDIYKSAFLSPIFRSLPFVQSKDRFESMDFEKGYGWRLSLYYKYFRLARRKVVAWIYNISIECIFDTLSFDSRLRAAQISFIVFLQPWVPFPLSHEFYITRRISRITDFSRLIRFTL